MKVPTLDLGHGMPGATPSSSQNGRLSFAPVAHASELTIPSSKSAQKRRNGIPTGRRKYQLISFNESPLRCSNFTPQIDTRFQHHRKIALPVLRLVLIKLQLHLTSNSLTFLRRQSPCPQKIKSSTTNPPLDISFAPLMPGTHDA